jgi:hypothetical protein
MIDAVFSFGATEILGETPADRRDALLFIRRLGFRPFEEVDGLKGRVVHSRMERDDYGRNR